MIPAQAVEAALTVLRRDDLWELSDEEEARLILEAAAPHMLRAAKAEAWEEGGRAATGTHDTGYPSRNPYMLNTEGEK